MPINYGTNDVTSSGLITATSGNFINSLAVNSVQVSVSGHTHSSSSITNFNSSISGLLNTGYGISSSASSLVTITAAATRTPGQKIYLDSNKTPKFRIGSVIPNIYRGSTRIYYRP